MAAQVDREHLVEVLGAGLQQITADCDADVVHEQMKRGERARGGFDRATALILDAHVGGDGLGAATFVANRSGGLLREFERPIGDHHGRAFARAHDCGRAAIADREFVAGFRRSVRAASDD